MNRQIDESGKQKLIGEVITLSKQRVIARMEVLGAQLR
jgi:hypothetical protein